mgnify:FL=1
MQTDFLILGYGFTARYAAYRLLKEFPNKAITIIARHEDFNNSYSARDDYIFLRYGKEGKIRKLLEELKILNKHSWHTKRNVKIGFLKGDKVSSKVSDKIKEAYYEKVFDGSTTAEKLKGNIKHFYNSQRMVNVKYSLLLGALHNYIKDKFTKVEDEIMVVDVEHHKARLSNNEEIYYRHLISTVPLDIFQKSLVFPMLSGLINELSSLLSKKELYYYLAPYTRMQGYDQLYVLDKDSPVLRFIKTSTGTIIKETFERSSEEPLSVEPYGKLMVNNFNKVNNITGLDSFFSELAAKNVYLAGRVAKWQSYHYTEDNMKDIDEILQNLIS